MVKSSNPKIKESSGGERSKKGKSRGDKNTTKSKSKKEHNNNGRPPRRVDSVVFDVKARREHILGSSARKSARRAYGLAMQQVKNRTAKLSNRAQIRQATAERIEAAEAARAAQETERIRAQRQREKGLLEKGSKKQHADGSISVVPAEAIATDAQNDATTNAPNPLQPAASVLLGASLTAASASAAAAAVTAPETLVVQYEGKETQEHWGGRVVVTTSTHVPDSDDESDEDEDETKKRKRQPTVNRDVQQEYAGQVEKYLKKLKGHMPATKKRATATASASSKSAAAGTSGSKRGGTHGAAGMKGVGSAATLKVAQKVLARSAAKVKQSSHASGSGGSKKRSRGKR